MFEFVLDEEEGEEDEDEEDEGEDEEEVDKCDYYKLFLSFS